MLTAEIKQGAAMSNLGTVAVRNYMTTKLMTFSPNMEVMTALRLLVKHGHSGAPVVDETGTLKIGRAHV